jgi:hypothetical protein
MMPLFIRKVSFGGCHFIMWRSAEYLVRRANPELPHAAPIHLDVMPSRRQRNAIKGEGRVPASMWRSKWSAII